MKSSFISPRQTERETEIMDECINSKHKQPFSQEVQPGKLDSISSCYSSFLFLFWASDFFFPVPASLSPPFLPTPPFPFLPSSAFSFLPSSAFFCKFFILCTALSCFSRPVTWISLLRRLSRSSLSLSSFFAFSFAWYLWWGWPDFMKLRSSGVGLNSEQWQCCNLPSCQPFLTSNWHFWQMVQMSAQCLLSKTEKVQISGQMQIICTGWEHCIPLQNSPEKRVHESWIDRCIRRSRGRQFRWITNSAEGTQKNAPQWLTKTPV